MKGLEQISNKTFYDLRELDKLSSLVLYTSDIKITPIKKGIILAGGLEIKYVGKNTIVLKKDYGGVADIYKIHPKYGLFDVEFHGIGKGHEKVRKIRTSKF